MQIDANMVKRSIIRKPLFRHALIIWAEAMEVIDPQLLVNPMPMILTWVGYSSLRYTE